MEALRFRGRRQASPIPFVTRSMSEWPSGRRDRAFDRTMRGQVIKHTGDAATGWPYLTANPRLILNPSVSVHGWRGSFRFNCLCKYGEEISNLRFTRAGLRLE